MYCRIVVNDGLALCGGSEMFFWDSKSLLCGALSGILKSFSKECFGSDKNDY